MAEKRKSIQELSAEKARKTMEVVAWKAGYYRQNPHRYVSEVLLTENNFKLKWFQKILLWAMVHYNFVMYLAARGQGKTFLTAIFCCVRCILWPKTWIVVTAGTLKQANEVLLKVQDILMPQSAMLRSEIKSCNIGQNDASIYFWNGSYIKTRTSSQNARSARATIIIVDEFRMVEKEIVDTVLKKFLSDPRHPGYLNRPEYAHLQERNKEIYMSSCWLKSHWSWEKARSYTANFLDDTKKYFIAGLSYQVSIREGLLMRSQIEDEFSEQDFNFLTFQTEMECLWYGENENSLFKFDDINKRRKIKNAFYPLKFYNDKIKVPDLAPAEKRILSVDVALMGTTKKKKNDASALYINSAIQMDDITYQSNIVYGETFEGLTTDELGIIVMRYFYKYKCTDLVLDCNGIGLGVYDYICKDQYDAETGDTYKALYCCNDDDMALRCKVRDANKVVWSVKATANFNNEICILLRNGIQNGKISFLISENECEEEIKKNYPSRSYSKLSSTDRAYIKMPYVQTTMAEYELIKLDHEIKNGNVKVKEIAGMRKDRYSSIAYNYWCACQLELKLKPKQNNNNLVNRLTIRPGRRFSSF